jgi:hypothetical protein
MWSQGTARVVGWETQLAALDWTTGGRNWLDEAGGDSEYAIWLVLCDQRCARAVGVGIFDLADWTWADAFESGASPADAVREALSEEFERDGVGMKFVVYGNRRWGAGATLAEAKANFRAQGGRLSDGYGVLTFDADSEFLGLDVFGRYDYVGTRPEETHVPARKVGRR